MSDVSWKDAINKTISEASKSIDYINSMTILEQKAIIDGNKIIEYHSTVDLCFNVDDSRK
ncbi:MAG: dodecin domain-containing protein [Clostridiales bacterium]|nr:dodecin domain-containing protein [Clostridiales bacterium]